MAKTLNIIISTVHLLKPRINSDILSVVEYAHFYAAPLVLVLYLHSAWRCSSSWSMADSLHWGLKGGFGAIRQR